MFYAPKIDFWVVSRYEDIQNIVKDPEAFSNARVQEPLQPLTPEALEKLKGGVHVTPTTSTADPHLHKRTRKHTKRVFSAKHVAGLEGRADRTVAIVRRSRRVGTVGQLENWFLCRLRDRTLKMVPAETQLRQIQEVVGYEV